VTMGALAVLGVLVAPVREFFLLAWPTTSTWLAILIGGGAAVAGIQAVGVARWIGRLTSRVSKE
ncbi:P-ATPase superfamily cation transporter, partial [human gut metagenome]